MRSLVKRFCRWVLEEELTSLNSQLKSERDLSHRLATRLLPYKPPILDNGECMSEVLNFHLDISTGLKEALQIPSGHYKVNTPLLIGNGVGLQGEKFRP